MTESNPPSTKHFLVSQPIANVTHIQINRPAKLNAFSELMWHELSTLFSFFSHSQSTRVIVLSGAGPAFTAGLDLDFASSSPIFNGLSKHNDPARTAAIFRRNIDSFQACVSSIEKCEKPVICALHGYAFGLGVDISCCADMRICAEDAKFSVKEVDLGLAADIGTLTRLPKCVGAFGWVKEVCLTGRVWDAGEAERVGFVNTVVSGGREEVVERALEIADTIAKKSPVAVVGTKELLNWSRDHTVSDGLRYTSVWNSAALQTRDLQTAISSTINKRNPRFEKL